MQKSMERTEESRGNTCIKPDVGGFIQCHVDKVLLLCFRAVVCSAATDV